MKFSPYGEENWTSQELLPPALSGGGSLGKQ